MTSAPAPTTASADADAPFDASAFIEAAYPWLVAAFVASFFLGALLLWTFQRCDKTRWSGGWCTPRLG